MQTKLAELLLDEGQAAEALVAVEKAVGPLTELVEQYPEVLLHKRDLAVALRVRAEAHLAQDNRPAAEADAARAVGMLKQLVASEPTDEDFREQLQNAEETLARSK
jgi:hypothetical protein